MCTNKKRTHGRKELTIPSVNFRRIFSVYFFRVEYRMNNEGGMLPTFPGLYLPAKLRITVAELLINLLTFALSTSSTKENRISRGILLRKAKLSLSLSLSPPRATYLSRARRYRRSRKPLNFESGARLSAPFRPPLLICRSGLAVTTSRPSCARYSGAEE